MTPDRSTAIVMAARKATLAKTTQDVLTCAVCLDRFKNPKILPCLHSFCADCLQGVFTQSPKNGVVFKLMNCINASYSSHVPISCKPIVTYLLSGHVSCPECRVVHAVPSKGFTDHFLLAKLVEHLLAHEAEEKTEDSKLVCESGLDSNTAAGWCVDCQSYLCQQCMDLHKRQKMSKSHKTLTLAEVTEGALTRVDQKHMCLEHEGEELKIYCRTCQGIICRDCTIVTHKAHDYMFLKDAKEEVTQELRGLLVQVEKNDAELQKCITDVETEMATDNESACECEEEVNKYFNEYIQKMERHITTRQTAP